jgi:hypothetical protein
MVQPDGGITVYFCAGASGSVKGECLSYQQTPGNFGPDGGDAK